MASDFVEPLIAFLNEHGLETGGTGSLVRPVVSCKGTTCQYGLIDTFDLSEKIHERFYKGYHGVTLPHKFKIAVGGCPNNCVKPSLNDLGIVGQRLPMFDFSKCRGCKVCQVENACPIKVAKLQDGVLTVDTAACNSCGRCKGKCAFGLTKVFVNGCKVCQVETACPIKVAKLQDGVLTVDTAACNSCGRCKGKCPFGVTEEYVNGCKVYIGGRWGKKVAYGRPLSKLFTSEEEVMDLIERAILFFRDEGITGERFSDTIDRLGFDYVEDKLLNGKIEKDSILEKKVTGGATC